MSEPRGDLKFLLVSEDSGKHWPAVQQRFARLLLRSIDPDADLERVRFDPISDEKGLFAARANRWRAQKPDAPTAEAFRALLRAIATQIALPNQFCSFHYDGDSTWSRRGESTADERFDSIVRSRLRHELGTLLRRHGVSESELVERVDRMLSRLLPVVPHYSIEAWLFQNTDSLREACAARNAGGSALADCEARCEEWAADRGLLDEVPQVKSAVCVGDTANDALADRFTNRLFDAVIAANKSLAATRDRWRASDALRDALEAIRR